METAHLLLLSSFSIALIHTLAGPDHYLPFVVLSRERRWTLKATLTLTVICGLGHIVSSIALASIGLALGWTLESLQVIDQYRGSFVAWGLILFGLILLISNLRILYRHEHEHQHFDGTNHSHSHNHGGNHVHVHPSDKTITPWILFTLFFFGPCEPLVILFMLPAIQGELGVLLSMLSLFTITTLASMVIMVTLLYKGTQLFTFSYFNRYSTGLAGIVLLACGVSIEFLGL